MSNSNNSNGICEILQVILVLQKNAMCVDSTLDSCDRPVLGSCTTTCCVCNTRPVMLDGTSVLARLPVRCAVPVRPLPLSDGPVRGEAGDEGSQEAV